MFLDENHKLKNQTGELKVEETPAVRFLNHWARLCRCTHAYTSGLVLTSCVNYKGPDKAEAGPSRSPAGSRPPCPSRFRMSLSHKDRERLLLDVLLVPRSLHGFGSPSLLFLTYVILKRKIKKKLEPLLWNHKKFIIKVTSEEIKVTKAGRRNFSCSESNELIDIREQTDCESLSFHTAATDARLPPFTWVTMTTLFRIQAHS